MSIGETILDLIINGEDAAANAALAAGHPTAFVDTVRAAMLRSTVANQATSGSNNTIGTGSKTFTLDEIRGWRNGTPVYIMDAASPSTNFMRGALSADETSLGVITVNVTAAAGSGTFTSWVILALFASATVVTPPLAIADGGTGATTAAAARLSLGIPRTFQILGILSTPPGAPTNGDAYLVGGTPTGAWASNENDIATYNGATWDFVAPIASERAYDAVLFVEFLYTGTALFTGGAWGGSEWKLATPDSVVSRINVATTTRTITVAELSRELLIVCEPDGAGAGITLTLPNGATSGVLGAVVNVFNRTGSFAVTINIASGGLINGAASYSLATQYTKVRLIAGESGGGAPSWYVL